MKKVILMFGALSITLTSCKKKEEIKEETSKPAINIPTTYNFDNVNYDGQTIRLDMLEAVVAELEKANEGNIVDGNALLDMFSNTGNPFNNLELDTSGKQLRDKVYNGVGAPDVAFFENILSKQGTLSAQASNVWSPGNPGVATSGTEKYFLDSNGVNNTEIFEKGIMGAVFYYNIAQVYTRAGKIGDAVDNTIITPGEGTNMEHYWDEAFGYWGAPVDFSASNTTGARYYAKYTRFGNRVGLETTKKVMDQFIKGRYGITNKKYNLRDEAATQVRKEHELILVTAAIYYLNSVKANFGDDALRLSQLSEVYGFIFSLAYNSDKLISNTDLNTVKGYFEVQGKPNFLNITIADLNAAINKLSSIYGLDAVKDIL